MLTNYLLFLRSPVYVSKPYAVQWREMLTLFALYIAIGFTLGFVIYKITEVIHLNHQLEDLGATEIWLAILLIPPIEELLFRIWLRVNRKTLLILSGIFFFLAFLLIPYANYWIMAGVVGVGILIAAIALWRKEKYVQNLAARHFGVLFYLSVLIFGLVHIFNYTPLTWQTWLLAPVLVLPQFIAGSMLGFIRVRYGILYSILFHTAINSSLLVVLLLE